MLIQAISHSNSYDFTQQHRHNYYEILFFENGGGTQLIDFLEYPVEKHACYIVHPKQVHLLKRAPGSKGWLIQFRTESIASSRLLALLQGRIWEGVGAIFFEKSVALFQQFSHMMDLFVEATDANDYANGRNRHLLQVLLFDLLAQAQNREGTSTTDRGINGFLQLVDAHFQQQHTVRFYLDKLGLTDKKLGALTKRHLGISPLQAIHHRLLLETKRLLLFGDQSHKEIAYSLGFDSPSSFSAFVKRKAGRTPSELQAAVEEIHK